MFKRTNDFLSQLRVAFDNNQVDKLAKAFGTEPSASKLADQTVSASTAFVTDNDLNIQLQTGVHSIVYDLITPSMTGAGGLKLQLVASDGLTVNTAKYFAEFMLTAVATVSSNATALSTALNGGTTNAYTQVRVTATIDVQNPGTLLLQWAQQAASGSTTLATGSTVKTTTVYP